MKFGVIYLGEVRSRDLLDDGPGHVLLQSHGLLLLRRMLLLLLWVVPVAMWGKRGRTTRRRRRRRSVLDHQREVLRPERARTARPVPVAAVARDVEHLCTRSIVKNTAQDGTITCKTAGTRCWWVSCKKKVYRRHTTLVSPGERSASILNLKQSVR